MSEYEFGVGMSCSSCANAVDRVLKRVDGVKKVDISSEDQKVLVETSPDVTYQQIHDTIAKTGKPIKYGKEL